MSYLLDNDKVNYVLRRISPSLERYEYELRTGSRFVLSPVVHFEVTRYMKLKGSVRLQRAYEQLIQSWETVDIVGSDWETATDLWAVRHRRGRPITDADLLIAVTALKTGAILVTNNTRHYEGLGLTLENWSVM